MRNQNLRVQKKLENAPMTFPLTVTEAGFYTVELTASSSTNWREKGNESTMIRLSIDGSYQQDIILFYGERLFTYSRFLGRLEAGQHTLQLELMPKDRDSSRVFIEDITVRKQALSEKEKLACQFTPLLYGRNIYSSRDNLYTDTPLLLLYVVRKWEKGNMIEYHMVFSHEDEGTPAPFLMSKWGRTLDIELMCQVYLNWDEEIEKVSYQGAEHVMTTFKGSYLHHNHPILQTATCNGNFTDEITSDYRFFFYPSYEWRIEAEPREVVMEKFPFINQVMVWEAERQLPIEKESDPDSLHLADLTTYLYIQTSRWGVEAGEVSVDFRLQLTGDDNWYSSSFHDFRVHPFSAAYSGPYPHFATTLKMPAGKQFSDVEKIAVHLLPDARPSVLVKNIKVLSLQNPASPKQELYKEFCVELTEEKPEQIVWEKESFSNRCTALKGMDVIL
ncbi:hypothetical protein SAMN05421736_12299 [Evansella caseinilytica]|uniref:Uncharacterized protein n=1 Tax=Evansella caseinilytica TaxID=1503961 RepID=A0A1H3UKJ1_9BACI|nr:hypothetical protein [Evansella caseinilytica]SDZ62940.1 hypothetical protein SAMN05421736_12299 [Evansella caseinilytica]